MNNLVSKYEVEKIFPEKTRHKKGFACSSETAFCDGIGIVSDMDNTSFFGSGALFQGKGGQPVFEEPARHRLRQGRGWLDHPSLAPRTRLRRTQLTTYLLIHTK